MRALLLPVLLPALMGNAAAGEKEDETINIRAVDAVASLREYMGEHLKDSSKFHIQRDPKESLAMYRLFARSQMTESFETFLARPRENAVSNIKSHRLTAKERELVRRAFPSIEVLADGTIRSDARNEKKDQMYIWECGNVRLVYPYPHNPGAHGKGCTGKLTLSGYHSTPMTGSGGGVSGDSRYEGFVHISEADYTACLFLNTPMLIHKGVLRVEGKYFDLKGRKTTVFMYDDVTLDKIVVE